jgi:hypothetical protein
LKFKLEFEILSRLTVETEVRILEDGVLEVHITSSPISSFE